MKLPKIVVVYISSLVLLSLLFVIYLINQYGMIDIAGTLFWVILGVVAESLAISLPNGVGVSVGFAITLAAIITHGPLTASIEVAVSLTCRVVKMKDNVYVHLFNTPSYKTIFNVSQGIIITAISGLAYIYLGGSIGEFEILPTIAIIPIHIVLNCIIMSKLFSLLSNNSFLSIWVSSIKGVFLSAIAIGIVGIIVALAYLSFGPFAVLLFFGPLLLARYSFKLYVDMRNVYIETIHALNKTMEAKDPYTSGHALRVQDIAVKLAEAMELPDKKIQNIKTAAILHDIGKIGVDDSILKKPDHLSNYEYSEIQKHASMGAEIIKDVDFLKDISQIIRCHHERYDGKGYPNGLIGEQIPIEASILAIADVYDAMTSNRPYRKALDMDTALKEIKINAGKQFEPVLAQKFFDLMQSNIICGDHNI